MMCLMQRLGTQPYPRHVSRLLSAPLRARNLQVHADLRKHLDPHVTKNLPPPGVWSTSQGCVHDIKERVLHLPALIFIRLADSRPGVGGGVALPADWLIS